jgi:hypothetical protein
MQPESGRGRAPCAPGLSRLPHSPFRLPFFGFVSFPFTTSSPGASGSPHSSRAGASMPSYRAWTVARYHASA